MATLCLGQELQRQSILPDGAQAMHTLSTQIGRQLDDEAVQGNGTAHEAHLFVQPVALGGFMWLLQHAKTDECPRITSDQLVHDHPKIWPRLSQACLGDINFAACQSMPMAVSATSSSSAKAVQPKNRDQFGLPTMAAAITTVRDRFKAAEANCKASESCTTAAVTNLGFEPIKLNHQNKGYKRYYTLIHSLIHPRPLLNPSHDMTMIIMSQSTSDYRTLIAFFARIHMYISFTNSSSLNQATLHLPTDFLRRTPRPSPAAAPPRSKLAVLPSIGARQSARPCHLWPQRPSPGCGRLAGSPEKRSRSRVKSRCFITLSEILARNLSPVM